MNRRFARLGPWLTPTCFGPLVTIFGYVTLRVLLGHSDPLLGSPLMNWIIGVSLGSVVAAMLSVCLLGFDVAILATRSRRVPTGTSAWLQGLLAPVIVWACWRLDRPGDHDSLIGWLFAVLAPLVVAAAAVRLPRFRR